MQTPSFSGAHLATLAQPAAALFRFGASEFDFCGQLLVLLRSTLCGEPVMILRTTRPGAIHFRRTSKPGLPGTIHFQLDVGPKLRYPLYCLWSVIVWVRPFLVFDCVLRDSSESSLFVNARPFLPTAWVSPRDLAHPFYSAAGTHPVQGRHSLPPTRIMLHYIHTARGRCWARPGSRCPALSP